MARAKSKKANQQPLLPSRSARPPIQRRERTAGRPINADGEETRRRILSVARDCFAAYGYAATSNRLIADRTGYTSAAVYHHFGRKNELMIAVYEATEAENYARMRAAIADKATLIAKVEAILDVTHSILAEDPSQATFMFVAREEAKRHEDLTPIAQDRVFGDLFNEIVAEATAAGEVDAKDAKFVRSALLVVTSGLANLGTGVSPSVHKVATESCKRLIAGSLLMPT